MIGPSEIVVLFVLALIVFGPKKLPEIGRTVGQTLRELKRMSSEVTSAFEDAMEEKRSESTSREWEGSDSYSANVEEEDTAEDESGAVDESEDDTEKIASLDNHDKIVYDSEENAIVGQEADTVPSEEVGLKAAAAPAAERSGLT